MSKISCPQTKCNYNQIGIGGGCKACEECGCEPNIIDQNCDTCMNCANKENSLRWNDSVIDLLVKNKELVVELK